MVERQEQACEVGVERDGSMKQAREWHHGYTVHSLLFRGSWSVSGQTYRFFVASL